ncbi:gas vesicle protein GvpH [Halegenticoccus soli]|uniref:gas vesicle protein GvpH n=1 Tax=Halegenticoccus soli TaxID=1985678 RepID=UPI000C6D1551|nr:gas vesicle protein GvpH [Halegenticoccus soli]
MTDDDRAPDRGEPAGLVGALRRVLETLHELDAEGSRVETRRGVARSGGRKAEYGYSIRVGSLRDEGERSRPSRTDEPPATDRPVSVREVADGAIVVADLPDVDPETLAAGVDGRRLTVAADGDTVVRVDLSRAGLVVGEATYNNGVLELRLRDATDGREGEEP